MRKGVSMELVLMHWLWQTHRIAAIHRKVVITTTIILRVLHIRTHTITILPYQQLQLQLQLLVLHCSAWTLLVLLASQSLLFHLIQLITRLLGWTSARDYLISLEFSATVTSRDRISLAVIAFSRRWALYS